MIPVYPTRDKCCTCKQDIDKSQIFYLHGDEDNEINEPMCSTCHDSNDYHCYRCHKIITNEPWEACTSMKLDCIVRVCIPCYKNENEYLEKKYGK